MSTFQHTVTSLDIENEYPKLVRDRIPEIIKTEGARDVPVKILNDSDFEWWLRKKAIEEATELAEADSDSHLLEEIADVREILEELIRLKGFTTEQIQTVQTEKRQKRGGFDKRILMLSND